MRSVQWTRYDGVDMVTLLGMAAGVVGFGAEDRDRLLGKRPWNYPSSREPSLARWLRRLGLRIEIHGRIATIRALRVEPYQRGDLCDRRAVLAVAALRGDRDAAEVLADEFEEDAATAAAAWWRIVARVLIAPPSTPGAPRRESSEFPASSHSYESPVGIDRTCVDIRGARASIET